MIKMLGAASVISQHQNIAAYLIRPLLSGIPSHLKDTDTVLDVHIATVRWGSMRSTDAVCWQLRLVDLIRDASKFTDSAG